MQKLDSKQPGARRELDSFLADVRQRAVSADWSLEWSGDGESRTLTIQFAPSKPPPKSET